MKLARKIAVFALFAASIAVAQIPVAQGPSMGFVIDARTGRLHSVLGVPGATVLGGPAVESVEVTARAVSPRGKFALVRNEKDRLPAIWSPTSGLRSLEGLPPNADRVVFSPEGSTAALLDSASKHLLVISGLPDHPSRPAEITLASACANSESLAVSDDGELLICSTPGEENPVAIVFDAMAERNRIVLRAPATALAFAPHSHDAVIASGAIATLVRDADRPSAQVPLTVDAVGRITAVAVSSDRSRVILASAASGKVALLTIDGNQPPLVLDCGCAPTGLFQMNEGEVYRLDDYASSTVHFLDIAGMPRLFVLPPATESTKLP